MKMTLLASLCSAILVSLISNTSIAAPVTIDVPTILPDGTGGSAALRSFAKAVATGTKDQVNFKFIWGGSAGSDTDVLSAIKAGKHKGAMFAGQIMDEIAPIMREGEIPFQFGSDRAKARSFVAKQSTSWATTIEKSGFHSLGFYEAGFVYLCSKKPIKSIGDVKSAKIWLWPGDQLGKAVITQLSGQPTEVPVQDSYKAFADGRLEMAYAPAIGIVALQWYTKANHVVSDPISYATGTFLVDKKTWDGISPADQAVISKLAQTAITHINDAAVVDEKESLDAMKSMGVNLTGLPASEKSRLAAVNKSVKEHWKPSKK
jgi:TRAP-type C4-dicarboxylate transport system substrate-binding protein